jgi:hypothetical protein
MRPYGRTLAKPSSTATIFSLSACPRITMRPISAGTLYGLLLWAVMNLVVLPLRWPSLFPHFASRSLVEQLFSHIVLVGLPMAWMTGKAIRHT